LLFQVWDFEGEHYDLTFYIVEENDTTQETRTHVLRSRYGGGPRELDRDRELLSGIFWLKILEREGAEDDQKEAT
jgi:hypothetical protein